MTGRPNPSHRTDDIRQTIGAMADARAVRAVVTAAILAVSAALFLQSFGPSGVTATLCAAVVAGCTALFTVEICFRMIAGRVGFLGKAGNVLDFLIVATALFTPFDAVLMLRLFPVLKDGVGGRPLAPGFSVPAMALWAIAFIAGGAREMVIYRGELCAGWSDCITAAAVMLGS